MTRSQRWAMPAALGLLLPLGAQLARAEVSVDLLDGGVNFLVMEEVPFSSHTEDPNPVGLVWDPLRSIPPSCFLNPDGMSRGDRRPDAVRLSNGMPAAVWTYVPEGSSQIAFSEWTGSTWQSTQFLTGGQNWNWNPRVHVEPDDTLHVVWWEQSERVYLRSRSAGSTQWDPVVQVTDLLETGRRPSVTTFDGKLWVAYERSSNLPGVAQEVVVAVRLGNGPFVSQVLVGTTRTGELDATIQHENGKLWLGWRNADEEYHHVEWTGSDWSAPVVQAWSDFTWLGIEQIRRLVRREVLLP